MSKTVNNVSPSELHELNTVLFENIKPFLSRKSYSDELFKDYLERKEDFHKTYKDIVNNKMNSENIKEYSNLLITLSKRTPKDEILSNYRTILINESVSKFPSKLKPIVHEVVSNGDYTSEQQQQLLEKLGNFVENSIEGYRRSCTRWVNENTSLSKDGTFEGSNGIGQVEDDVLERVRRNLNHSIMTILDEEHFEEFKKELENYITNLINNVRDMYIYKGYVPLPNKEIKMYEDNLRSTMKSKRYTNENMFKKYFDAYSNNIKMLMNNISLENIQIDNVEQYRTERLITLIDKNNLPFKYNLKQSNNQVLVFTDDKLSTNSQSKLEIHVSSMGIDIIYPTSRIGVRKNHSKHEDMTDYYNKLLTLPLDKKFLGFIVKNMSVANDLRRSI